MQRRQLIDDNLPESLLSSESLFGACRRLRSAHKTHGTLVGLAAFPIVEA